MRTNYYHRARWLKSRLRPAFLFTRPTLILSFMLFGLHAHTFSQSDNPDNIYWSDGFEWPGVFLPAYDAVRRLEVYDNSLIFGGKLSVVSSTPAKNIIGWDGSIWRTLGNGVPGGIWDGMTTYDGKLVVASQAVLGGFKIMAWDGAHWFTLADSAIGWVGAMLEYDGKLVIAGDITQIDGALVARIAYWDQNNWLDIGGGTTGSVRSLAVFHNHLIAGGKFTSIGGISCLNIAVWNGTTWAPLGAGVDGEVDALVSINDRLFAGGAFSHAGGVDARNIASWNDSIWEDIQGGVNKPIRELAEYRGNLIVGGSFDTAGSIASDQVAEWDGSNWEPMNIGRHGWVTDFAVYDGLLHVAGNFVSVPGAIDGCWGVFDTVSREWIWPYANGATGPVQTMFDFHDTLFVGGEFTAVSTVDSKTIAAWDGYRWSSPYTGSQHGIGIRALAAFNDELIAGGDFDTLDGKRILSLAVRRGSSWFPIDNGVNGAVSQFAHYHGGLVVGGNFNVMGDSGIVSLASWDGANWHPFGNGLRTVTGRRPNVHTMTVFNDQLVVGGKFDSAGTSAARNVAIWSGSEWAPMSDGLGDTTYWNGVGALAVFKEQLIAGGYFSKFDDQEFACFVRWNGSLWESLGMKFIHPSIPPRVLEMVATPDLLYVGGVFDSIGSISTKNIAIWNGSDWSELGSGISNPYSAYGSWDTIAWVQSLALFHDHLYVGGRISMAGNKVSCGISRWEKLSPTDVISDDVSTPDEIAVFQNYPNPFNPLTTIEYSLDYRDRVTIDIFNSLGQYVKSLVDDTKSAGQYRVQWDGSNSRGHLAASGVYFYRVKIGETTHSRKMVLIR